MNGALISQHELAVLVLEEARRRRRALLLLFAAIAALGLLAGFVWPKKYSASTSILVQESNIIKPLMEGRAVTTGNADRAAIAREVIFSRKIMDDILVTGGWMQSHPSPLEQERIIEGIKRRTSVSNMRENLIKIEYDDSDPQRAFAVARRLGDQFIEQSLAAKENESREAYEFISNQVNDYRKKLTDAEERLKSYRASNPDARPGSETDTNTRISELRTQIENARMQLMEQRSAEHALVDQVSGESQFSAVQTREMGFRTRLAELQGELDKLRLSYTDQHPDVVRVRHQIEDLKEQLRTASEQSKARRAGGVHSGMDEPIAYNPLSLELRSKLAETRRTAAGTQSRMAASETLLQQELDRSRRIADSANVLSELTRDYEVNRDIYQDLLKRRENARVSMNLDADHRGLTFNVQEPAMMPLRPVGLRFMHFGLAGIGLGVLLPFALLFALVRWDPRLRSPHQLVQFTGLPLLASVPHFPDAESLRRVRRRDLIVGLVLLAVIIAYATALALKWTSVL